MLSTLVLDNISMIMEGEWKRERSSEENDQLSRSTKKMKRTGENSPEIDGTEEMDLGLPKGPEAGLDKHTETDRRKPISYRDTLQRNNLTLTFDTRDNHIWMENAIDDSFEDDEPMGDEGSICQLCC